MGIGDFFKKLFSSEPPEVDYSGRPDWKLLELWERRDTLRDDAVEELAAEMERRGVEPSAEEEDAEEEVIVDVPEEWGDIPDVPDVEFDENVLFAQQRCGVFLQTEAGRFVMVVFPLWNGGESLYEPQPPELPEDAEYGAVIVLNERHSGWLPTRDVVEDAEERDVLVLDAEAPADRDPNGEGGLDGESLDGWWTSGGLALRRIAPNTLQVVWQKMGVQALVGSPIPVDTLREHPATLYAVGGVATPARAEDLEKLGDDLPAGSLPSLDHAIFLLDDDGCSAFPWMALFPRRGINVQVEGAESFVAAPAHGLIDAAFHGDDERMDAELDRLNHTYVMPVVQLLAAEGRLDCARRVVDGAIETMEDTGTLHLALGFCQALAGEDDDAAESFQTAATHENPDYLGHAYAAAVHAWNGRFDEAVSAAEALEKVDVDPERGLSAKNLAAETDTTGGFQAVDLKEASKEDPVDLLTADGLRVVEADEDVAARVAEVRPMPLFAQKLVTYAQALNEAGRHETAVVVADWALHHNPFDVTAMGARARAMAENDQVDEALAWLEEARKEFPDNRYLRLIRAELLFDLERYDESTTLYEELVDEHSDWAAPRAQLVATYAMDDMLDEAQELFDELDEIGIDDQTAFTLERLMDEARLRLGRPRV